MREMGFGGKNGKSGDAANLVRSKYQSPPYIFKDMVLSTLQIAGEI
ncbi:hypothetical protein MKQ70_26525 [Chitinophaga sedimenti]|nr:hypothetical protein [Chitinophaga sedimenti]MCK7558365.1 hypothetical protein [Chitinophaga sedimenti]